jgi:thioredoxin 1
MKNIVEANDSTFAGIALSSTTPALVDFYAPWCGPCRMLAPALEALAREYEGRIKVVKINVDESPELAHRYNITGVPTLMLFKDGEPAETIVGLVSLRALKASVDKAIEPSKPAKAATGWRG